MKTENLPANLEQLTAVELYQEGRLPEIVSQIREVALSIVPSIETNKGRDEIKSLAYKIARSKTTLDSIGKEYVAEIKAKAKAVDTLRADMRESLDELKVQVRAPLDEWEREQERIAAEQKARLAAIESPAWPEDRQGIVELVDSLQETEITEEEFGEHCERAASSLRFSIMRGEELIDEIDRREAEAAEVERLRAELAEMKAKAEAFEAEKRERENEEIRKRNKAEAAKRKREDAKAAKERAAAEAKERAEREARIAREAAEKATRAAEAEAKRKEDERVAEAARAAEIERQRAEDAANVERIESEVAEALYLVIGRLREKNDPFVVTSEAIAKTIIEATKAGEIPHLSINY